MKPKQQRLRFLIVSLCVMGFAAFAILRGLSDSLVFFYTPTEWQQKHDAGTLKEARIVRIGGLVRKGSIRDLKDGGITFTITDLTTQMQATYSGIIPALFRDGQGVVAEGTVDAKGTLDATTLLAKHDENYMPPQVVEQLRKAEDGRRARSDDAATPHIPST
ncbi:MAG: cytochrome c maturation protein CcmE [Alphaproteobacteria bacterium]